MSAMRDYVTLHINGRPVQARGDDALLPLSDFLRRKLGLTGTKIVCAEGDCGSCAVLLGRPASADAASNGSPHMNYRAICSCIATVLQADSSHVVTIEGLSDPGSLNPVQDAMVRCQGTQCGFCTPGFVVAMCDLLDRNHNCTAHDVRRGLVGNLCRCTGYDSIIQAAMQTDRAALVPLDDRYPAAPLVQALQATINDDIRIGASRLAMKAATLPQALRWRAEHPESAVIAGTTDLGVVWNKRGNNASAVLCITGVPELAGIELTDDAILVGGAAAMTDFEQIAKLHHPEFAAFLEWFGSPLIRNGGTMAGNICTGSPIGDTIPALQVLDASLELISERGARIVPINAFYTGYRQTVMQPGELLGRIIIPRLKPDEALKLYKVSRRKDLDISTFGAAIWIRRRAGLLDDIRIAFGAVAPTVIRMTEIEDLLRGQSPTLELFERAADLAADFVKPISDVRGSAEYRRRLAGNTMLRFYHDIITSEEPSLQD